MRQQKQLDYEPPRDALLLDIEQSHLDHSVRVKILAFPYSSLQLTLPAPRTDAGQRRV